jgi:hypothetical protein
MGGKPVKFLTIIRTDLSECLLFILLTAVFCLAAGLFFMWADSYSYNHIFFPKYNGEIDQKWFWAPPAAGTGPLLFIGGIIFGFIMAILQFQDEDKNPRTPWQFLLHRSASHEIILAGKLSAGLIGFLIAFGVPWIVLYSCMCNERFFLLAPMGRTFAEGWIFIWVGYTVYLGIALAALHKGRWNPRQFLGVSFSAIVITLICFQSNLVWSAVILFLAALILLSQLVDTFLKKEF